MVSFAAHYPTRTLTLHKNGCPHTCRGPEHCGCGPTSMEGTPRSYCETHVTIARISAFMDHQPWTLLLCPACYGAQDTFF